MWTDNVKLTIMWKYFWEWLRMRRHSSRTTHLHGACPNRKTVVWGVECE